MRSRTSKAYRALFGPQGDRAYESATRRGLKNALYEGIPATILTNLLGGPLQTAFLLYLGFRSEQIGLMMAIPSLTLLIQIFVAYGMQRWQNRRLLVTMFAIGHRTLWTATGLIPVLFPDAAWAPMYIVVFLASYLFAQACGVIWTSLMADIVPAAVRGRYFGIRNTIHWAVACLTLLLGGQLLEWFPGSKGFTILFAISAVCVVWNGIGLSSYPNPPFSSAGTKMSMGMLLRPFRNRDFVSATLFLTAFILVQNVVVPLYSYAMLNVLGLSYRSVSLVTTLQNLAMMISYLYWGNLNARYPVRKLLPWTFPLIALACVLWLGMAVLPVLLVLLLVHLLLGFGLGGYNLLVFNFLIGDTPKTERPMYIAVFSALTGLAGFIGPVVGGWLFKLSDEAPLWLSRYGIVGSCGLVLALLAAVVAPLVFREKKA